MGSFILGFMTVQELRALPHRPTVSFSGVYLLKKLSPKIAKSGNEFLIVELGDKTGAFNSSIFQDSPTYSVLSRLAEGSVLHVEGQTDYYQDRLSPRLASIVVMTEEECASYLSDLVETSPVPFDELWAEFLAAVATIQRKELRLAVENAVREVQETFPYVAAAVSMHHAYRHGLLEHTVRMTRAARALLPLYPEVDADLALAGICLHDLGKCIEYTSGLNTKRTRAGNLAGHVVLGYRIARRAAMLAKLDEELLERLEHIILSHQGLPEWGAAVLAATPEAVFVSLVDNLDAKMGMVQATLRNANGQNEFSEFLPGLGSALLVKPIPAYVPETPVVAEDGGQVE